LKNGPVNREWGLQIAIFPSGVCIVSPQPPCGMRLDPIIHLATD
jgi:hypothetical protein